FGRICARLAHNRGFFQRPIRIGSGITEARGSPAMTEGAAPPNCTNCPNYTNYTHCTDYREGAASVRVSARMSRKLALRARPRFQPQTSPGLFRCRASPSLKPCPRLTPRWLARADSVPEEC